MNRTFSPPKRETPTYCTVEQASAHILAITAIDTARAQLARYALATDWPPLGTVEAADLLDAARAALTEGGCHATA
jgi:hypothetical protein